MLPLTPCLALLRASLSSHGAVTGVPGCVWAGDGQQRCADTRGAGAPRCPLLCQALCQYHTQPTSGAAQGRRCRADWGFSLPRHPGGPTPAGYLHRAPSKESFAAWEKGQAAYKSHNYSRKVLIFQNLPPPPPIRCFLHSHRPSSRRDLGCRGC